MDNSDFQLDRRLDELAKNHFIDIEGAQMVQLNAVNGVAYLTVDGRNLVRVEAKNFACVINMEV